MFNEFLTTTLQVVIALNVAGLITYFCLGTRKGPTPIPVESLVPAAAVAEMPSLWNKLVQPCRNAMGSSRSPAKVTDRSGTTRAGESLDSALGQLRRVLDGYGTSLQ